MTAPQRPLDRLCQELTTVLGRDPKGKAVAALLERYAREEGDWAQWTFFDAGTYTRNLVHRSSLYELLILGWEAGQASPIHDHDGQHCWMAVLEGPMQEVHFRAAGPGAPLTQGALRTFERGEVAYIADEIALHRVQATPAARGVSLHLYSSPIDTCRTYDPTSGEARRLAVGYHSVRGVLCGEKSAASVRAEWAAV